MTLPTAHLRTREQQTLEVAQKPRIRRIAGAIVRHKLGMLYGFEFLELARDQAVKIAERCRKCEPWRSNARAV